MNCLRTVHFCQSKQLNSVQSDSAYKSLLLSKTDNTINVVQ